MMAHVHGTNPLTAKVFTAERTHRKAIKRAEMAPTEDREKMWAEVDRAYEAFCAAVVDLACRGAA